MASWAGARKSATNLNPVSLTDSCPVAPVSVIPVSMEMRHFHAVLRWLLVPRWYRIWVPTEMLGSGAAAKGKGLGWIGGCLEGSCRKSADDVLTVSPIRRLQRANYAARDKSDRS